MQGALIAVLLTPPWHFEGDEGPDPSVLIGSLTKLDPSKKTFGVLGFSEMHIGIGACDAIYRMADGADLLSRFDESDEDGESPDASWRSAEFTDYGNDTVVVMGKLDANVSARHRVLVGQMHHWSPERDEMVLRCSGTLVRVMISRCSVIQRFVDDVQVDLIAQVRAAVKTRQTAERIASAALLAAEDAAEGALRAKTSGHVRTVCAEPSRQSRAQQTPGQIERRTEYERLRALSLLYRQEAERDAETIRVRKEERDRWESEQANTPERLEARSRLAELLARYRVGQRETAIEVSLRRVIAGSHESVLDHTTCVALTDAERRSLRHAAIAKLVHAPREMCWSRAVYPGLDTGEFIFGTAPVGRQQYIVRYPVADDLKSDHFDGFTDTGAIEVDSTVRTAWHFLPNVYVLHDPTESDRPSMWSFDGSVPPPGYPVTTLYEKRIQNCTTTGTPGRMHGAAKRRQTRIDAADRISLYRQKFYASNSVDRRGVG